MDFTTVIGIDRKTIEYLKITWPTWAKFKPFLVRGPLLFFFDDSQVKSWEIAQIIKPYDITAKFIAWPPSNSIWPTTSLSKWDNPQRIKMLSGFVHVPAKYVYTPYWMKLDVDVVATNYESYPNEWFQGNPSIIASSWGYSKPPDIMVRLDQWVDQNTEHISHSIMKNTRPLNLSPTPGAETLPHQRICSWCALFSTEFTKICADLAEKTCGPGRMPVESQDGYMWYVAKRAGFTIRTVKMKRYGWAVRTSLSSVAARADEALKA